jgi:hypothetical protein
MDDSVLNKIGHLLCDWSYLKIVKYCKIWYNLTRLHFAQHTYIHAYVQTYIHKYIHIYNTDRKRHSCCYTYVVSYKSFRVFWLGGVTSAFYDWASLNKVRWRGEAAVVRTAHFYKGKQWPWTDHSKVAFSDHVVFAERGLDLDFSDSLLSNVYFRVEQKIIIPRGCSGWPDAFVKKWPKI